MALEFDFPEDTKIGAGHVGLSAAHVLEFRSMVRHSALKVDKEARTVDDVILAQVGEAKGHGVEIEQSFLDDMSTYVSRKMSDRVQCNFGHRWNSLGFQLGAFSELRVEGKAFKGKLSVYKAADKSPEMKGMAEWFMDIADEDAKAVMCSIKFEPLHYYQYDDKGQKLIIQYSWYYGPMKVYESKPAYVAFKRLISCDVVDEGALTESLFSDASSGPRMFGEIIGAPGFVEWFKINYQHYPQLQEFYQEQDKFSIRKFFTSIFNNSKDMDPIASAPPAAPVAASTTPAPPAPAAPAQETTDLAALQASITAMQAQLTQLQATNTAQAAEITALKAQPAAAPAEVKNEDPARVEASASERPWENSEINKKARAFSAQANKASTAAAQA